MTILYQYPPQIAAAAPVGGATEAKQDAQIVLETALNSVVSKEAKQDVEIAWLNQISDDTGALLLIAATGAKQDLLLAELQLKADLTETQPVSVASLPLPSGAATAANQALEIAELQKVINTVDTVLTKNDVVNIGGLLLDYSTVDAETNPQGVSGDVGRQVFGEFGHSFVWDNYTHAQIATTNGLLGPSSSTPPANDTDTSALNGRLIRIAQRISSLIALLPTSLGQKTMANSLAVTIASDQSSLPTSSTPSTVAGTITSAQVAVGTSAVRATVSGGAPNAARKKLMIKPNKNNTGAIYIGASGVTTANGLEIIGPDRLEFDFDSGDYYLISDLAAQVVEIVEKA